MTNVKKQCIKIDTTEKVIRGQKTNQYEVYRIASLLAIAPSLVALVIAHVRGKGYGSFYIQGELFCALCILLFSFIELSCSAPSRILLFSHVDYAFIAFAPVFWYLFALQYSLGSKKDLRALHALLSIVPLLTTIFAFVDSSLHLIWRSNTIERLGSLQVNIVHAYGPWFWVHCFYSYSLYIGGAAFILRQVIGHYEIYRNQAVLVILATGLPIVLNMLYVPRIIPGLTRDFSPIALAATGILFTICIEKYKLLELSPPAGDRLAENLDEGIIVVDTDGCITYCNEAALEMLAYNRGAKPIGSSLHEVLPACPAGSIDLEAASNSGSRAVASNPRGIGYLSLSVKALVPAREKRPRYCIILRREASSGQSSDLEASLSRRELEIAGELANDTPIKLIAARMYISENTVKTHIRHIYRKTGTKNRRELKRILAEEARRA